METDNKKSDVGILEEDGFHDPLIQLWSWERTCWGVECVLEV